METEVCVGCGLCNEGNENDFWKKIGTCHGNLFWGCCKHGSAMKEGEYLSIVQCRRHKEVEEIDVRLK